MENSAVQSAPVKSSASQNSKAVYQILRNVGNAIVGKDGVILRLFLAILAGGHILIEDIPGVGKTTLALAFSKALSLNYSRIQFTPDVLPSDITGFSIYDKDSGQMRYSPGAVLCNLFLADELNRATSRTQSALLEAMEEGQVTVDGVSHVIPQPFIVIATQNPVGAAGTQLLPDSQIDRFMIRLSLGYPSHDDELKLLERRHGKNLLELVEPVITGKGLALMRNDVENIHVDSTLLNYIVTIVGETRRHADLLLGASPRASIALTSISKAMAYVQGRDYVIPADITPLIVDTLAHRLVLKQGLDESVTAAKILGDILGYVKTPSA
ncbi:MAG: MoxR family ATPase [Oscillospiraceae bacterium]|nr:MoxR family ATPase [Oscillospiraceae bacterium]